MNEHDQHALPFLYWNLWSLGHLCIQNWDQYWIQLKIVLKLFFRLFNKILNTLWKFSINSLQCFTSRRIYVTFLTQLCYIYSSSSFELWKNIKKIQNFTLFLLGGRGVNLTSLEVFFYITQKILVWGCWNFLTFLKSHSPSFRYKTRLLYLLPESSGTLPEWLLFSCNKQNLCFDPLSVVIFWWFLAI